jgi:putative SOS response-associated peptidase YedK
MCGRFLTPDEADFERHWQLAPPAAYRQSFNVAPSQLAAIVRMRSDGSRAAELYVWGFKPAWSARHWINARAETVFTSAAFSRSARGQRCLVPAAGWYEWQGERAPKQPFVHFRDGFEPIAFAGIFTSEKSRDEPIRSFAILTRPASAAIAHVHDRMPVVLAPAHYSLWLDPSTDRAELEQVLRAPPPEVLTRRISTRVNKPEHDDPSCIEPLAETGTS